MSRRIRMYEPGRPYDIVISTANAEHRLRPTADVTRAILGVLAYAMHLHPGMRLHYFVTMSNHIHVLVTASDGITMARFQSFLFGQIARKVGHITGISGPMWGGRAHVIPLLDEASLVARLRYLISQGCKEGLVARPGDWPGASTYEALVGDMTMVGVWHDRQRETRAARKGKPYDKAKFLIPYTIQLTPIAPFAGLDPAALRRQHLELVASVIAETEANNRKHGRRPLGADKVRAQALRSRPAKPKRSPAPLCHAATASAREAYLETYRAFVTKHRTAAAALRRGETGVAFPPGSFPPPRPWVAYAATACAEGS